MNRNDPLTRTAGVALLLVSLPTVVGSDSSSQTRARSQPIRQIDHIMIRTGDPRGLYAVFAETLQLPIAWPMTSPRAGVITGGMGFGNVNVEAIQFPGQADPRPRLVGFALEPSALDESVIELNRRGLTSGEQRPLVKAFLRDRQLLGADAAGQVTIDPSKVGGLDLRLVEG